MNSQAILTCLPLLADILGRTYGVTVEIGGDDAFTTGQVIRLPSLPATADPTFIGLVRGYIDHESAHVRHTDFDAMNRETVTPLEQHVWNIIEDWRVEQKLAAQFPGCRQNFRWLIRHMFLNQHHSPRLSVYLILDWLLLTVRSWEVAELTPTALDDPAPEPPKPAPQTASTDDVAVGEKLLAEGDHTGAYDAATRALAANPNRADAWFLKGRVLMLDRNFNDAEPAMLKAVALDQGNAKYLNGLGAVNASKGSTDRALAAYRMAIDADPADGFAWYNSGVIHFNAGDPHEAADAFYGAGLAYLKTGDYPKAERALSDLRDLAKSGIPVQTKVKTIEDALTDATRRKS